MASEKTPALFVPTKANPFEEKSYKDNKYCSKTFISWILAALLTALIVALCVQFLYPFAERRYKTNIETVHYYDGTPIEIKLRPHSDTEQKMTEQTNDEIFNPPWHLDFLINPTRLCDTLEAPESEAYMRDPEIKLLMMVPSATSHFAERRTIRKTWGSVAEKPHGPIRLGFVLGTTPNSTEEELIVRESEVYGDIIQADFQDTYRNLTTKSVLMLKWVSKHCPHAQYFLKVDDDTFVNLPVLIQLLQKPLFGTEENFVGGYVHQGAQPSRIPSMMYYVSEEEYPEEKYPPYTSGSAYVTTGPTAAELFEAAKRVKPVLPMEDVFITGLCADDIAATRIHEPRFCNTGPPEPTTWDSYSSLATAHRVTPDNMDFLWEALTKDLFNALRMLDSSSSSEYSDWFGSSSISISDLFNLPESKIMLGDMNLGDSELGSTKWSETGSIFDLFNLLKTQVNEDENNFRGRQPGSDVLNLRENQADNRGFFLSGPQADGRSLNWSETQPSLDNPLDSQEFQGIVSSMKLPEIKTIPYPLMRTDNTGFNITYFMLFK